MFNYSVSSINDVLGWHLTTLKGHLIHAINFDTAGRVVYGKLWIKGLPIQKGDTPTPLPSSTDQFWVEAPRISHLLDPKFEVPFKLLKKMAFEKKALLLMNDQGFVENIAIYNGNGWTWAAQFRKDHQEVRELEANQALNNFLESLSSVELAEVNNA